jgi:L,D-transpeptidase ErfK/SrfK
MLWHYLIRWVSGHPLLCSNRDAAIENMTTTRKWRNYLAAGILAAAASISVGQAAAAELIEKAIAQLTEPVTEQSAQPLAGQIRPVSTPDPQTVERSLNLVLSLSDRRVSVYSGDMLIASYEVAVGREGWNTPTGQFSVFQKQTNPTWQHPFTGEIIPPGPENPLGTRWIGFWSDGENSIGFHGTPDESVIGSAVSHGCVRMRNADVLALYEQVDIDTPVTVLP